MERVEVLTMLILGGDFFTKKKWGGNNMGRGFFLLVMKRLKIKIKKTPMFQE